MGNIELHERVFGGGLVGNVQVETGLSWLQEQTLNGIRDATRDTAVGVAGIGWGLSRMTEVLGMRLDQQTKLLTQSLSSLQAIHETLRTPAKTRAAERVADAGMLLDQGRAAPGDDRARGSGFAAGLTAPKESRIGELSAGETTT